MDLDIAREVAALQRLTVKQLRRRYAEVFGEETNSHNKTGLVRRIAWRLQALAEGDLSERAQRRAADIACDADLRMRPPRVRTPAPAAETEPPLTTTRTLAFRQDDRLPPPGTVLTRRYKDGVVQVTVLADGFEYDGAVYPSLSSVAKAVTGSHCNGYLFFRLDRKGDGQ